MKSFCIAGLLCLVISPLSLEAADRVLLSDNFSSDSQPQRRAMRGDWKFVDGVASCTQNDELYKKFQDHGPILFYDLEHENVTVRFAFKAEGAKTFVFTANDAKEHVFRFVMSANGTSIRAFPSDAPTPSISLGLEKSPLPLGEWVPVEVTLNGKKAILKIGDQPAKTYEHPSFARPKTNLSIGFSFGTLSVKDLVVTP